MFRCQQYVYNLQSGGVSIGERKIKKEVPIKSIWLALVEYNIDLIDVSSMAVYFLKKYFADGETVAFEYLDAESDSLDFWIGQKAHVQIFLIGILAVYVGWNKLAVENCNE